jgi:hypothetical protein
MKRFNRINFLLCGIALLLAAFPVFAQKDEAAREVEINRKPLDDFARIIRQKIEKKETDFDKPFLVEIEGSITEDGKFDAKKSKFTRSEGDREMVEIGKMAIEAIGDSGFFIYLKNQGIDKISFSIQQDEGNFSSVIKLELQTVEKAKTTASALNLVFMALQMADNNGTRKLDENSKVLINNSKVSTQEKSAIINFSMPKLEFHEMLMRQIMKSTEKNKNVQS